MTKDEFERTCGDCSRFMEAFLGGSKTTLGELYDAGLRMARAATHIDANDLEDDDDPEKDHRLGMFRLAEALVESSFLKDMFGLSGQLEERPDDDFIELSKMKFQKYFSPSYFQDNPYAQEVPYPNVIHGMNFGIQFLRIAPTLDFTSAPREVVMDAVNADIVKVTGMILWAAALNMEKGAEVEELRRMLGLVYSLKYGIVMHGYSPEKVKEICDEVRPWMESLRNATAGERAPEVHLN